MRKVRALRADTAVSVVIAVATAALGAEAPSQASPAVTSAVGAQARPQPNPESTFEVASVKRNVSGEMRTSWRTAEAGTVSITNAPIRAVIVIAYEIELFMDRFFVVDATDGPLLRGGHAGRRIEPSF